MIKTFSQILQVPKDLLSKRGNTLCYDVEDIHPFNELILSWRAKRPEKGSFMFYVKLRTKRWSPWIYYASWGKDLQQTFTFLCPASKIKSFQDRIQVTEKEVAKAFKIKIVAKGGAILEDISELYISLADLEKFSISVPKELEDVFISDIPARSQMKLDHHRKRHLCSPTSISTVLNYLRPGSLTDPVMFATHIRDQNFDIYGNWVLNVAQANALLAGKRSCCAQRLSGFEELHGFLQKQLPVVVSVTGPLKGSATKYDEGHLLVVNGYDKKAREVMCIDPAFTCDRETFVRYALSDFLSAWGRKQNLAYTFA